jgi:membrane protein DedA with SNARE-associated domain
MEKIFEFLTDLSGSSAYGIIFGILVACGLGFPLPEDIPLIAAGYLVWDETLLALPAVLITLAGVLAGDTILFMLGRKLGLKILEQERVQTFFKPEKVRRTRAYFRKYGDKIVFFARFVAGFRAAAFFLAGALRMEYRRFVTLDGLAALISVPIWIAIGYGMGHLFGDEISRILQSLKHLKAGFTVVIFAIIAIVVLRTWFQYRRAQQQKKTVRATLRAATINAAPDTDSISDKTV